jgi:hypothetical protein
MVWSDLRTPRDGWIGAEVLFAGTSAVFLDCGAPLDDAGDRDGPPVGRLPEGGPRERARWPRCIPYGEGRIKRAIPRMISDLDVYLAANLLIRQHGVDAENVAAQRADLMLDRGDRDEQLVWMRIMRAIVELQAPATGKPN